MRPRRAPDPEAALDRAAALHARAVARLDAGDLSGAARRGRRALDLFAANVGGAHPDVANCLDTLAVVDMRRGDLPGALRRLRRAAAILARYPRAAPVRPLRAQLCVHLGAALRELGRYDEARPWLRRGVRLAAARGDDPVALAQALNQYGILCKHAGWFAPGLRAYQRALSLAEPAAGAGDLVASILHNLAGLEHARDRFAAAEPWARRALALRVRRHGADHPDALEDAGVLAASLADLGRDEEAEAILRRLLGRFEEIHGRGHYEVAVVCHNLGALAAARGELNAADALYRRALRIKRAALGPRHPDVAITAHNLAGVCAARGRVAAARAFERAAYDIARAALGARHPTTRACVAALRMGARPPHRRGAL